MEKAFQHLTTEDKNYQNWEAKNLMAANNQSAKPKFVIPLPPPNVTGQLHLGHAAMLAIEDIMTRYKKMNGHEVLWTPGTDHAAIATETVVLNKHGIKDKQAELTREEFMGLAEDFVKETGGTIRNQMKKMGAFLDWSREAYTFDEKRNHAVNKIFKMLYEDGLIYRGKRLINWSTGAQSVISDDELEWDEVTEPFYYIRCGEFVIGTVRPETKCADSPLMVHPTAQYVKLSFNNETLIVVKNLWDNQEKFFKTLNFLDPKAHYEVLETYTGKDLERQAFEYQTFAGPRKFYVLADPVIDPEKGSGAMTISSCHSADDYNLAQRLSLNETWIEKINFEGKMTSVAGPLKGQTIEEARKNSGQLMLDQNLLLGRDDSYQHRIPLCYRSNCVVEPMISAQWFIAVEKEYTHTVDGKTTLKKQMQAAVRENHIQIIPERFNKTYFSWIDNLKDWCISRQIWWGHQIPVWYDENQTIHLAKEQDILLVRHGESEGNAKGLVQSVQDPLTENGRQHARNMIETLKNENVGVIVTGNASRNTETAEIIAQGLGVEIITIPELSSYDTKDVAGMTIDEIGRIAAIKYCRDNHKGEDFVAFTNRLKIGLEKLKAVQTEGKIVYITNRSTYSVLQTIRDNGNLDDIFERRSKNSHLLHGLIDHWKIFQAPAGENLKQDEDTLDTWFSSATWPFATVGWPLDGASEEAKADFKKFYPADVLETGWDIIFFWVARMIMFGRYATGEYPFHTVYMHGMVTDEHGKKMSKSKGNGIDPLDMIEKFGADPVRLSLVIGTSPGNPIPVGENKIKGYRNFVNKLWNAGRFVEFQRQISQQKKRDSRFCSDGKYFQSTLSERNLLQNLHEVKKKKIKKQLKDFKTEVYHGQNRIVFDGSIIDNYFCNKPPSERFFRHIWYYTVVKALPHLIMETDTIGYFRSKNLVFRVVLYKQDNEIWGVKTFYLCKSLTEKYQSGPLCLADTWILGRFNTVAHEVAEHLDTYEISAAGDKIYHFVWDEFCDWYIECAKVRPNLSFLARIYQDILKLVHPLCPFVTEQIYQELYQAEDSLIQQSFPLSTHEKNPEILTNFERLQSLVSEIRRLRADNKLNPKDKLNLHVSIDDEALNKEQDVIKALANLESIQISNPLPQDSLQGLTAGIEFGLEIPFDSEKAEAEKTKKIAELEKQIAGLKGRLSNPSYTEKAPEHLVQQTCDQLRDAEKILAKLTN